MQIKSISLALLALVSTTTLAAECGRWERTDVEVCDERTVYVSVPVTRCVYEYYDPRRGDSAFRVRVHPGHIDCPAGAAGEYFYEQYHTTKQESRLEKYNCRMEPRWVWIPGPAGPGQSCPDIP